MIYDFHGFFVPFRWSARVEKKIGKMCKISGEKLVFSPPISYIILRWNAVNAVKLCKFTARVSGDLTKIHHNSALKRVASPLNIVVKLLLSSQNFNTFRLSGEFI